MSVLMYRESDPYRPTRVTGKSFIGYMMSKGFRIVPNSLIKG